MNTSLDARLAQLRSRPPAAREPFELDAEGVKGVAGRILAEVDAVVLQDGSPADRSPWDGVVSAVHTGGYGPYFLRPHDEFACYSGTRQEGTMSRVRHFSPQDRPYDPEAVDFVEAQDVKWSSHEVETLTTGVSAHGAQVTFRHLDLDKPEASYTETSRFDTHGYLIAGD